MQKFQAGKNACLSLNSDSFINIIFEMMKVRPALSVFRQPYESVNVLVEDELEIVSSSVVISKDSSFGRVGD